MSSIIPGIIHFNQVYQFDEFNESFELAGISLDGKRLTCQVREMPDTPVVLEFSEDDGSLTKTETDSGFITTVTLFKESDQMSLPPLFEFGQTSIKYNLTIIMYTDDSDIEDIQTIVKGDMEVVHQITKLPEA
jgi:hypothetical protein